MPGNCGYSGVSTDKKATSCTLKICVLYCIYATPPFKRQLSSGLIEVPDPSHLHCSHSCHCSFIYSEQNLGFSPLGFQLYSFLSVSPYRCFSETSLSRPLRGSTLPFTQFPNSKKENPEVPKGPPPFLGSTVRVSWGWECQLAAHEPPEPGGPGVAKRSWCSLEELRRGCLAEAGCGEISPSTLALKEEHQ